MVENRKENMHTDVGCKEWTQLRVESARFQCNPILHYTCSPLWLWLWLCLRITLKSEILVSLYFVLKLVWKISNILSNYNFLRLCHSHLPAPQKVSSFYFYFSSLLFIFSFSRFGHRDNGRISTQPLLHYAYSSRIKKTMAETKDCPWDYGFFFYYSMG